MKYDLINMGIDIIKKFGRFMMPPLQQKYA